MLVHITNISSQRKRLSGATEHLGGICELGSAPQARKIVRKRGRVCPKSPLMRSGLGASQQNAVKSR